MADSSLDAPAQTSDQQHAAAAEAARLAALEVARQEALKSLRAPTDFDRRKIIDTLQTTESDGRKSMFSDWMPWNAADDGPESQLAAQWAESFAPLKGHDYSDVLAFAQLRYAELNAIWERIDSKASWCFTGSVAAASWIIADSRIPTLDVGARVFCLIPLLLAAIVAGLAFIPRAKPAPMQIRPMLEYSELEDGNVPSSVAASLHCACCGMEQVIHVRCQMIRVASFLLALGLTLSMLAVMIL